MAQTVRSYRDLEVWQKGMDLTQECYQLTRRLPPSEQYGLSSQMRRAAVSIPSNIAEGHSRPRQAYLNHLSIALGSLAELETQIELAMRLGIVPHPEAQATLEMAAQVGRMLHGLINALNRAAI